MQTGWVERHGRGWRGGWREHGTKRYTTHVAKKGDARALLNDELRRIEQGSRYHPDLTLAELAERSRHSTTRPHGHARRSRSLSNSRSLSGERSPRAI